MSKPTFESIAPPEWPQTTIETEAAFGRFLISWNVLEREIDRAIEDLYDLDYDLAWSVTANLGTRAKLDIFQSAFHCLHEYFEDCSLELVDKLAADTAKASGEIRAFLVHGQPFKLQPTMEEKPGQELLDIWVKIRGRKGGLKGPMFLLHEAK